MFEIIILFDKLFHKKKITTTSKATWTHKIVNDSALVLPTQLQQRDFINTLNATKKKHLEKFMQINFLFSILKVTGSTNNGLWIIPVNLEGKRSPQLVSPFHV